MKRLWPGWVLCGLTIVLFVYMAAFEAPAISARINGTSLPDTVVTGYDHDAARTLYAAFTDELAQSEAAGRQSASAAYVSMHAGSDLLFPPMLAASLAFLAFAGLNARGRANAVPRSARITLGIAFAVAFTYLGFDYVENAVADALFGPPSLKLTLNADLVPVLRVLTIGKYLAIAAAVALILSLWIGALRSRRRERPET
ncbi:MAG: hypothetical protein RIC18_09960 [Hoeflea sp.]|uniref:hypothetical protein n=1 Tax=Hoeflea sp. TaxID=1940281 RepID=UPI0032F04199